MTGNYRVLVPDGSSTDPKARKQLDACPGSPQCQGEDCPWPARRFAIVSTWAHLGKTRRGLGMLSVSDLELVLGYSRDHPKADIRHVEPLTPLRLEWWDPREGGKRGVWHIEAYDAASLASELHMINRGVLDEFRFLDGGLLYLIGEPQIFWSMVMHYRAAQSCCPPIPDSAPISSYEHCVGPRTVESMLGNLNPTMR